MFTCSHSYCLLLQWVFLFTTCMGVKVGGGFRLTSFTVWSMWNTHLLTCTGTCKTCPFWCNIQKYKLSFPEEIQKNSLIFHLMLHLKSWLPAMMSGMSNCMLMSAAIHFPSLSVTMARRVKLICIHVDAYLSLNLTVSLFFFFWLQYLIKSHTISEFNGMFRM